MEFRLIDQLPTHISMSIEHNPHKVYYETIEQYLKYEPSEWISEKDYQTCIENDELWELYWHPHTPVGSCTLYGYNLESLFEIAKTYYDI